MFFSIWLILFSKFALAQSREFIIQRSSPTKEARSENVSEHFVGSTLETSLETLESMGLNASSLAIQPWTGYFWANLRGGLGYRWQDRFFPTLDWKKAQDYVYQTPFLNLNTSQLSPSEKYDLAMNIDPRFQGSLTQAEWDLGKTEYERTGGVQGWQGICHGWAPASVFYPTPKRDVLVKTQYGEILFKVDDLKALASSLWANGRYESVYAGYRCRLSDIPRDNEGRVLDPVCFNLNPGDWHLILTNMLGIQKRPFIIDIDSGVEVWNKPIISYSFTYFDLINHSKKSTQFKKVMQERSRLGNLRFRNYRSDKTFYVVGVESTVVVGYGNLPGETQSQRRTLIFKYDLELDENFQILGGEWRSEKFPDFLWRPQNQSFPENLGNLRGLDLQKIGNKRWSEAAEKNNSQRIPLKVFVDYLFQEASR